MKELDNKEPHLNVDQSAILEEEEENIDEGSTFDAAHVHLELNDENVDNIRAATVSEANSSNYGDGGQSNQRSNLGLHR